MQMKISARILPSGSVKIPGRASHATAVLNESHIIVCGGEDDDVALSDTWVGKIGNESVCWERVAAASEFGPRYAKLA